MNLEEALKFIHIENKIKAMESLIKNRQEYASSFETTLSQTEYYYARLFNKKFFKELSTLI